MQGHGSIERAILVLDQNESLDFVILDEKAEPFPARPIEFRQVVEEDEAQRPTGNNDEIVVSVKMQTAVQKFLKCALEPIIAAMNREDIGFAAPQLGRKGIFIHSRERPGPGLTLEAASTQG